MEVLIPRSVRRRMKRVLLSVGSREIGGILMGEEVGQQRFKILDFSVDTESGTNSRFSRDADHHERELEAFFRRTGEQYRRFNYVGEWHSHPSFSVDPSVQDLHAMQGLVNGSPNVHFAILLITRLKWRLIFESSATLFVRSHQPVSISLVLK